MKFTQTDFTGTKEILKFPDHYVAIAVTVDDTGITPNADGKKIVPKGTIMGGTTGSTLADDTIPVAEKNTQGVDADSAEGVLFNDVDVTYGPASGAMIIHGFIDLNKLPAAPAAAAVTAMKMVQFID